MAWFATKVELSPRPSSPFIGILERQTKALPSFTDHKARESSRLNIQQI
jgi:hypothetical protein